MARQKCGITCVSQFDYLIIESMEYKEIRIYLTNLMLEERKVPKQSKKLSNRKRFYSSNKLSYYLKRLKLRHWWSMVGSTTTSSELLRYTCISMVSYLNFNLTWGLKDGFGGIPWTSFAFFWNMIILVKSPFPDFHYYWSFFLFHTYFYYY